MAKYQAFLFFPLLVLEGFSLHLSSVKALWRKDLRSRRAEMVLLVGHFAAYLSAVFIVLSPLTGVTFILVHRCLWGVYMGCSFAGRCSIPGTSEVAGGSTSTLGALNYQVELTSSPACPGRTCASLRRGRLLLTSA